MSSVDHMQVLCGQSPSVCICTNNSLIAYRVKIASAGAENGPDYFNCKYCVCDLVKQFCRSTDPTTSKVKTGEGVSCTMSFCRSKHGGYVEAILQLVP